jgi:hypothetical protein
MQLETRETRAGSTRRYDLDWLRVLAILTVFIFHSSRFYDLGVHPAQLRRNVRIWRQLCVADHCTDRVCHYRGAVRAARAAGGRAALLVRHEAAAEGRHATST